MMCFERLSDSDIAVTLHSYLTDEERACVSKYHQNSQTISDDQADVIRAASRRFTVDSDSFLIHGTGVTGEELRRMVTAWSIPGANLNRLLSTSSKVYKAFHFANTDNDDFVLFVYLLIPARSNIICVEQAIGVDNVEYEYIIPDTNNIRFCGIDGPFSYRNAVAEMLQFEIWKDDVDTTVYILRGQYTVE